jgi:lysophospholipase L1-like esterase
MPDDSLMSRFDQPALRSRARDGMLVIAVAALLLVLFRGDAIRRSGEEMDPGVGRDVVLAIGKPAAWLSPGGDKASGGFTAATGGGGAITADAFDLRPAPRRPLHTLLVTGDSMSMPLDADLARLLAPRGVKVIRDPHLGTGISKPFVVDWGELSRQQVRKDRPDAVVVFIGANEGFPLPGPGKRQIQCCGAGWAAIYAGRARAMADTYRRGGAARVYWITLPLPREAARQAISRTVNAAIDVAVEPWRSQVRVIDTVPTFTPHGYRDAMPVGGRNTIVRQPDGIHLNNAGAALLAGIVLARVDRDFAVPR